MTAPTFRKLLSSIEREEKIVPLLRAELWKPDFKGFTVKVEGFTQRKADGWFHPSVHPLWPETLLYIYLTEHERMIREPFDPTSTIAVTVGSFFHTFVQTVLVREGILVKQGPCPCGSKHPEKAEVYMVDQQAKTRGHSDGVTYEDDGFEFKTMNPMKMGRIPRGSATDPEVLEWFKKTCPDYYAQAQEYLRMGQRDRMVVVIMGLTYPFEMREIHVPFDRLYAYKVRDKYLNTIQAVADQRRPRCWCGPNNTSCPARGVCW